MSEPIVKWLVIEVDNEVALRFSVASLSDGSRFDMINAVLQSNPVLRLVDEANVGDVWNGSGYAAP